MTNGRFDNFDEGPFMHATRGLWAGCAPVRACCGAESPASSR